MPEDRLTRLVDAGPYAGPYADLRGVDLRETDLRYADLRGADMKGTNLWGADLRYADLRNTNLDSADLRNTNLEYADMEGANLRCARGIITAGQPDGYDFIAWQLNGVLRIKAGCHCLTFTEAQNHWASRLDRAASRAALDYVKAVAAARGWNAR